MAAITIEAKIINGQVRLPDDLRLPNREKVFVVIPDVEGEVIEMPPLPPVVHLRTPRFIYDKDYVRPQVTLVEE